MPKCSAALKVCGVGPLSSSLVLVGDSTPAPVTGLFVFTMTRAQHQCHGQPCVEDKWPAERAAGCHISKGRKASFMAHFATERPVVLVVEDEFLIRMRAAAVVENAGFEVVEATNA